MVRVESDQLSAGEEVEQEQHDQSKDNTVLTLGRQTSIYSLTLDEFQHTLCEGSKNFGSMNMDEFLNSIWVAEEAQAHAKAQVQAQSHTAAAPATTANLVLGGECTSKDMSFITKQSTLPRQGSLTLPAPLCQKTVEEVWAVIKKNEQSPSSARRQVTFGEMSLEDFLVKAGMVREQGHMPPALPIPSQYGLHQKNNNPSVGPGFIARPIVTYPSPAPQCAVGETPLFPGSGKRRGYGPVSLVSSNGMGANQVDGFNQVKGGRKRGMDDPLEKVVERRQRRMIKNRESAARSRARKLAYTMELEAELNLIQHENYDLKQYVAELERKNKELERERKEEHYIHQEVRKEGQSKAEKAEERLRGLRRHSSCPTIQYFLK